jgi:hypothetical protein
MGGLSFPDEKRKHIAEMSFDWNLIFARKERKKKHTCTREISEMMPIIDAKVLVKTA